jgi:hypothetical protein
LPDYITITGLRPYDGRYELDLDGQPLTTREWGWIKRHAGYLPLTLDENSFADPELVSVLAAIAARRAGTVEARDIPDLVDRLADAPFGSTITLEAGDTEGDADPPPESTASKPNTNGDSSPTGSDSSDAPRSRTGSPASDISASVPVTSAS